MGTSQSRSKENALNISISKNVFQRIVEEQDPKKININFPSEVSKPRPKSPRKSKPTTKTEDLSSINSELRKIMHKNSSRRSSVTPLKVKPQVEYCVEQKDNLINCLEENKAAPLNCSRKFEDFTRCAYLRREEIKSC